jgi:glycosyltransferase involved in cell wall biosynthesis
LQVFLIFTDLIYIDASRYSNTLNRTGVENYSYFLINELIKLAPDEIALISPKRIKLSTNLRSTKSADQSTTVHPTVRQIVIPFPRLWTQIRLSWKLFMNLKIKNLFVPSHLMPLIHPKRTVITIHDVAFKRFPKSYGLLSRTYLDWGTKYAVKHAAHIITPSETTKSDLVKFYKDKPEKITVIPLGFDESKTKHTNFEIKKTLDNYNLQHSSYFLYIGRIETKKNIQTLIKAFDEFSLKNPHIKLVLAGKPGVGGDEILKAAKNNANIIATGFIHNKEKDILLKNCLCFVFPSLFEGFGLPLLEAMQADVPIIASKIPTSYEIAKESALFFKPMEPHALAKLMGQIAENTDLRKKLTAHHKETLKKYSWERCAKKTLKILQKFA